MTTKTYRIGGMDCAGCAREVEDGVSKLPGVQQAQVNFTTERMTVDGEVSFETLRARVEALGKTIEPIEGRTPSQQAEPTRGTGGFVPYLLGRRDLRPVMVGGALLVIGIVLAATRLLPTLFTEALFVAATALALVPVARSGLSSLLVGRSFSINLLMTIAAVGALLIGETTEAATVVFLFAVGEALEGYTADRARDSLRQLITLVPPQATRLSEATEEIVPVEALNIGDTILVKPGERIAMDGAVLTGESGVNQAPITGESLPVHKAIGAEVFAGTINGEGALTVRVTRRAEDNTLSRIIQLVEEAQSVRAPSQRMIDQFARWYTPGVAVLAALVAILPPLLFGAPFTNLADGTQGWLYRALELLVIACPCSLVISTPVTVISAITAAARRGVLIKGGAHLEALGMVRAIAFDKTGTLTRGQPVVTAVRAVECETGERCERCDDVLALASAVEARSAHPLARSVVTAAQARGVETAYPPAEEVAALSGRGVQGRVNGKLVTVGSHALFESEHPHSASLCGWVDSAEQQGQTAMLLCDGDRVRGYIAVADTPREESHVVVSELRAMGIETIMLTGDNASAAEAIGQQVGVDGVRAGLMPADKVSAVQQLLKQGPTAMVGDGVNDTPALAAATVGVAMGGAGSAQALETADIALMADDLRALPYTVRLARFARGIIRQNIALSLGLKAAVMVLALAGGGTLWLAVFADVGMSLIVTTNGMRPLRMRVD